MKAMVLAAGLGTRLRPLTDTRPKALVEVNGRTLLDLTLARLRLFGVRDAIVNVHHHADMVVEYLKANQNFGMHIEISREDTLLDTGGGLKEAAWFFLGTEQVTDESFILHNVDVLSTIDLRQMVQFHSAHHALATLAVQERTTSRYLLFDQQGNLCGRRAGLDGIPQMVRSAAGGKALAFCGIHIISPRLLLKMRREGAFSIIDSYLDLAAQGEEISAFRADQNYWRDLGRPESLERAERDLADGKWSAD